MRQKVGFHPANRVDDARNEHASGASVPEVGHDRVERTGLEAMASGIVGGLGEPLLRRRLAVAHPELVDIHVADGNALPGELDKQLPRDSGLPDSRSPVQPQHRQRIHGHEYRTQGPPGRPIFVARTTARDL